MREIPYHWNQLAMEAVFRRIKGLIYLNKSRFGVRILPRNRLLPLNCASATGGGCLRTANVRARAECAGIHLGGVAAPPYRRKADGGTVSSGLRQAKKPENPLSSGLAG